MTCYKILRRCALISAFLAATIAQAKIHLTMYYPIVIAGPVPELMDSMISDFMAQNPDIVVDAISPGVYDETRETVHAAIKANKPVHVAVLFTSEMFDFVSNSAIFAYDDLIQTPEDNYWLQSFYPALMENTGTENKVWGIPFQCSTLIMIYNKDKFRAAGLDPEQPPKNWHELVDFAKQLTKPSESQWGLMMPSDGDAHWILTSLAMQNDQVLMNGAGNETYFDTEKTIEALSFWRDLGQKHQVMPKGEVGWRDLGPAFLSQEVGMIWTSTGSLNRIKKAANFDVGVAMLPQGTRRGTSVGSGSFFIFNHISAEERDAAFKLVRFMTSPEQSAKWSSSTGYIGTSPEAYDTEALSAYLQEYPPAATARDQLVFATAPLSTHHAAKIQATLDAAIVSALQDKASPAYALKKAQDISNDILMPYR